MGRRTWALLAERVGKHVCHVPGYPGVALVLPPVGLAAFLREYLSRLRAKTGESRSANANADPRVPILPADSPATRDAPSRIMAHTGSSVEVNADVFSRIPQPSAVHGLLGRGRFSEFEWVQCVSDMAAYVIVERAPSSRRQGWQPKELLQFPPLPRGKAA